ncbi:potassium transporter Kup [Methylobacillus caricis]|uniref:potassium transporter Kup n=1 Tax=Methylobacillus caricis TaxID=1971611 RepID=UPI001CFFA259|nr:potassium transporter Kup [Methylobacillus caricis]MCB5187059.1 potassium transporter Kup [Methylobacillus caricis]
MDSTRIGKTRTPILALAALGVVFGDIGTSPLYTMKEVFAVSPHPVPLTHDNVFGILALILWSLVMVVSVKYAAFVMRADNNGEGGIMALLALAGRNLAGNPSRQRMVMYAGIIGACMFYADGMITPAISVLSAIEGLQVAAPALDDLIVPVTLFVLVILFWMQSKGTAVAGTLFGPIMLLWFFTLGALGVVNILHEPLVLNAINPVYAVQFFLHSPWIAFVALGSVVLAVTGVEALYADMGHFGRKPIRYAWFFFVLPALVLNYFGQGALVLHDAESIKNPFYLMAPGWMLYPLIGLATLATVIASQAVISGAFSISAQALQLGYLPRMRVLHTSDQQKGQIYMPYINWSLMLAVMALVIGFGSSGDLAAAYGIAVTGNMLFTTLLAGIVFHGIWRWSWTRTVLLVSLFLIIDIAFFSANILKIPDGGWVPILIGIVIFTLMATWKRGRSLLLERLKNESMLLEPFIDAIGSHPPTRVAGTGIFMTPNPHGVPHAMLHNLKHNKILHERIVLLTVNIADVPYIAERSRLGLESLKHGFYRITVNYGFKDDPDLPRDLKLCKNLGLELDTMETSFFIGKETLLATRQSGMAYWRSKLFVGMFRNADSVTNQFKLPPNRVVELGAQIAL